MGILRSDQSIIIDSVLTDKGRELLAKNDGSFEIVKYTFADDEIDYSLFIPNTGSAQQDQNILNTPIFEAFSNATVAIKYPLISISDPDLKFVPLLEASVTNLTLGERADATVGKTLEFKQNTKKTGKVVPPEIIDAAFVVNLNSNLLFINNESPLSITADGRAQYVLKRTDIGANKGARVVFNIGVPELSSDIWDTLGTGTRGSRTLTTVVECLGVTSGLSDTVTITITEEFSR